MKACGVTVPSFGDPKLNDIYGYWLSKRRGGKPPRRADIKAQELPPGALPQINILEVVREPEKPLQFRHRLVGTGITAWLSRDATGLMVDEALYGADAVKIVASLNRIVETVQPHHRIARLDWNDQHYALAESVEMPLSDDTHDVAMILRGVTYRPVNHAEPLRQFFEPLPLV
jgi:hypothetical protein